MHALFSKWTLGLVALWVGLPVFATVYEVGAGDAIADVPWNTLQPGDTVLIHHRPTPYREKWVICRDGTESQPITISGVPNANGDLPVIEGEHAVTPTYQNYWNEARGVIKLGGANAPSGSQASWIVLENLDIKSGKQPHSFTGRDGPTAYARNAAAIYMEDARNVVIRNCILRDCGNGLFVASASRDILIEGCHIHDNGAENSIYEHNTYTEAGRITYQYNRFGPLRANCLGNNLKDRSAGCEIRYNWIEGGNRQLDLVDSGSATLRALPEYGTTRVVGNILIEPDGAGNSQICHYGGDSGDTSRYRKGTLFFHHNTVVSTRAGNTTLLRLSSGGEAADCRNNIVYANAGGSKLAMLDHTGSMELRANWLSSGWRDSFSNADALVSNVTANLSGTLPGFLNAATQDYRLQTNSVCINAGTDLSGAAPEHEYAPHQQSKPRPMDGSPDLGAFEASVDTDADGLPDDYEWGYTGTLTNMTATSSQDADPNTDLEEYIAGTDPTDPASVFLLTLLDHHPDVLTWPSAAGRSYTLRSSSNMQEGFTLVTNNIPPTPPLNTFTNPAACSKRVYRLEVSR